MAVHGRKLKPDGEGYKSGRRRKRKATRKHDELAPLWADLKLAILHGRERLHSSREYVPDVKVYRLCSVDRSDAR